MRSGNAVSSHSGLIPSETVYEKRGGLLWPIERKKNLSSPCSAASFTIFVCLQISKYFKNCLMNFRKNLTIPRLIINLHLLQVTRKLLVMLRSLCTNKNKVNENTYCRVAESEWVFHSIDGEQLPKPKTMSPCGTLLMQSLFTRLSLYFPYHGPKYDF